MQGMLGISMFMVGATLFLNGIWLLEKASVKSVGIFNLLVGLLCTVLALNNHFHATDMAGHLSTANTLLFAFTYLMVAANCLLGLDARALGWFSLYVAVATIPNMVFNLLTSQIGFSLIWLLWGVLWFMFFLNMALGYKSLGRIIPYSCIFVGIVMTGIPGYLILWGVW